MATTKHALAVVPGNGTANADGIMADAQVQTDRAATLADAKVQFAKFGERAGSASGIATEMAFAYVQLCMDGVTNHGNAEDLYGPYADGFNKSKPESEAALLKGSESYASGLSTFGTFGLEGAVSIQREVGLIYADIVAVRATLDSKKGVKSAYQCFVAANRAMRDVGIGQKRDALVATLRDADGRRNWIAELITPKDAEPKSELDRLKRLEADFAKCFKKSSHAVEGSIAHKRYDHIRLHLGLLVAEITKLEADIKLGELIKAEAAGNA